MSGSAGLTQADLALPGPGLSDRHLHRASRPGGRARALLTRGACWWAIGQLRREHDSVAGLARQLGTTWRTLWRAVQPLLETMAGDENRFDGVAALGVDEHIWHHVSIAERGPRS